MKRGRKIGQIVNPRDERGWMIPKPGTVRRAVYNALVAGLSQVEGLNMDAFYTHKQAIVGWRKVQEWRRASL